MPGVLCNLTFEINEELSTFRNKFWQLTIPFWLAPSYNIAQKRKNITHPKSDNCSVEKLSDSQEETKLNEEENQELANIPSGSRDSEFPWTITIHINSPSAITCLKSPAHPIKIMENGPNSSVVELDPASVYYPEKDFILLYSNDRIHSLQSMTSHFEGTSHFPHHSSQNSMI